MRKERGGGGGGGGGLTLIQWQYFLNYLTSLMKWSFKKKIILVSSSYFPLLSQFYYSSSLSDVQVWGINTWITNEDTYK